MRGQISKRNLSTDWVQFVDVAVLELAVREEDDILKLNIVEERQYLLVPRSEISERDLKMLKDIEPTYSV